jgi:AcrR family transcriptional regulator
MARPSKPLISRAAAVQAAIEIIDEDGLEKFNLLRLAQRLGVRTPSLYHHFQDRSEILNAIGRYLAGKSVTRPRRSPGPDWPEYFVTMGLNFRKSVLRHRNAARILIEHLPREILVGSMEDAAQFLSDSGVPVELHIEILDGLEILCIGAVLVEALHQPRSRYVRFDAVDAQEHPYLANALAHNGFTTKEMFAERIRSFLEGVMARGAAGTIKPRTTRQPPVHQ